MASGNHQRPGENGFYRAADIHPNRFRREPCLGGAKPPLIDRLTHLEQYESTTVVIPTLLRLLGLHERGRRNAENVQLNRFELRFAGLPEAFDGFRLLFLSDMHFDGNPLLTRAITRALHGVEADLCLFGGDFRFGMYSPPPKALDQTEQVLDCIRSRGGCYAVLGNHDSWLMMERLESSGLRMLINESVSFTRDGERIWLAGVDDPHFYHAADFGQAMKQIPRDEFCAVLCHTPEARERAARRGADLFLCGHTHAGQIRLPLVGPLSTHSSAPRRFNAGLWQHNGMTGYTSPGVGSSGIFVRFNCPPEVALITLRRGTLENGSNS
jgi:predicted MPP superfamily phosphohydrolase